MKLTQPQEWHNLSMRVLVALALVIGGCQPQGPAIYELSGRVIFKGKAIPAGMIFFDPDPSKGNDGPQGYAYIKNGRYDTRDKGKGVVGGPHRVRIHGFDGKPGAELPMGKIIFPEFSQAVELPQNTATQNFNVPSPESK